MKKIGIYNHSAIYNEFIHSEYYDPDRKIEIIDSVINIENLGTLDYLFFNVTEDIEFNCKQLKHTKVIFMSDNFTRSQVKKLFDLGAYKCLSLPIGAKSLLDIVTKIHPNITQERMLLQYDKYAIKSIRESLAYDLLFGNTKNAKEIWERSQLAKLSIIPNTVLLLSINNFSQLVHNKGELWKSSIRKEVLAAIIRHDEHDESLKVLVHQQKYAILLALPIQLEEEKYKNLAIDYANRIYKSVSEETDYSVTIGIGNYYEDARNLHLSYQESELAQTNRLFSSESSVIHIKDIDYFETPEYHTFKVKIQSMSNKFLLGDIDAIFAQWEEIYDHAVIGQHHMHPEEFRLQVLDLLFSLTKSAIQNGANPKSVMPLQIKYARELHEIETLAEINIWMRKIIKELVYHVNEIHNVQLLKSVQEVLQYIEENYSTDIGLDRMAEKVELSPNYLSAIFKQTTGSSFIDYLTDIRMKKAKEALLDFSISINEIASSTGYSSSQYFSRVFKSNVGMTPTEYRKNTPTNK